MQISEKTQWRAVELIAGIVVVTTTYPVLIQADYSYTSSFLLSCLLLIGINATTVTTGDMLEHAARTNTHTRKTFALITAGTAIALLPGLLHMPSISALLAAIAAGSYFLFSTLAEARIRRIDHQEQEEANA